MIDKIWMERTRAKLFFVLRSQAKCIFLQQQQNNTTTTTTTTTATFIQGLFLTISVSALASFLRFVHLTCVEVFLVFFFVLLVVLSCLVSLFDFSCFSVFVGFWHHASRRNASWFLNNVCLMPLPLLKLLVATCTMYRYCWWLLLAVVLVSSVGGAGCDHGGSISYCCTAGVRTKCEQQQRIWTIQQKQQRHQ